MEDRPIREQLINPGVKTSKRVLFVGTLIWVIYWTLFGLEVTHVSEPSIIVIVLQALLGASATFSYLRCWLRVIRAE
ncbi:hypothetical protein [Streptomyces sp. CBMA29]|uniref:hypothetical protein n=1 Tax=Streptomyces sp. CBMA29 TaxID=1896314 RepID=UPI0016618CE0|nr:hypothetical protein [Streptomyces sp. CBMA29]